MSILIVELASILMSLEGKITLGLSQSHVREAACLPVFLIER
jgi:hypothetical protein